MTRPGIEPRTIGEHPTHQANAAVMFTRWPYLQEMLSIAKSRCPHDVMVKALDCGIVVSKFELQSR